MWVANLSDNTVLKVRASDGAILGTFAVGSRPYGVAFDGTDIWVANQSSSTVTKLDPSGTTLGTFAVGTFPSYVAFDGTDIWVTDTGNATVTKLSLAGAKLFNVKVGSRPDGIAFDGANVWVANQFRTSPGALAFDGANIWVTNSGNNVINIWVANFGGNTLSKISAEVVSSNKDPLQVALLHWDKANQVRTEFAVGSGPLSVAFDGASIWVANSGLGAELQWRRQQHSHELLAPDLIRRAFL